MNIKRKKRVVVAMNLAKPDGRRNLSGLMRYLNARRIHWDIRLKRGLEEFSRENVAELPHWNIDGVIYSLPVKPGDSRAAADLLVKLDIPLVIIDPGDFAPFFERKRNIAIVKNDPNDIGRAAAESFLSQGACHTYGYVPDVLRRSWSTQRGKAFAEALRLKDLDCLVYEPTVVQKDDFGELRKWLKKLPKPAGVLVAYDDRALTVIEACTAEGLSIPGDVSILSIDNDDFLCENCIPTLSSIQPNHEKAGYAAGALLSEIMRKPTSTQHIMNIPVGEIIHRNTTLPASQAGKLVQKALVFIRKNAGRSITVSDVVAHLKVSRPLADLRFRQLLSTSIGKTIEDERLKVVARRLVETRETLKEIADDCSFSTPFHLMNLFKRHFGVTMSQYRQQHKT